MCVYGEMWGATTIGIPNGFTKIEVCASASGGSVTISGITADGSQDTLLSTRSGKPETASIVGYNQLYIRCDTWNNSSSASIKFLK